MNMNLKHTQEGTLFAAFAAGCFWGVQEAFDKVPGVVHTTVGYTGGKKEDPTYEEVCDGGTGHAEAILIEYDPGTVNYNDLLDVFWRLHDPTQVNRQGPDEGHQYRSAIFYFTPEQEGAALASKDVLEEFGDYDDPIATEIEPMKAFYPAEEYHQHYYKKNPDKPRVC